MHTRCMHPTSLKLKHPLPTPHFNHNPLRRTSRIRHQISTFPYRAHILRRQRHRRHSIRRNFDRQFDLFPLAFPARDNLAVAALEARFRKIQFGRRLRLDQNMFVSHLSDFQASRYAVHPVADGTISVVVEGVHARVLEGTVGLDAVPALPDGGCPHFDRVQPGRIRLLEQEVVGYVGMPIVRQDMAEVGCPQKARRQVVAT